MQIEVIFLSKIRRNVGQQCTVLAFHLARVKMLLLPRPRILEPDLRDPFAEPGYVRYPFEVLAVGVAVQLKVRLQHRELLLGKGRSHALRLTALATVLGIAVLRGGRVVALDHIQVVSLAEQPGVQEGELLTRGQLARAGVAGETRQVVDSVFGPSHPIARAHAAPAFRTLGAEGSANTNSGIHSCV